MADVTTVLIISAVVAVTSSVLKNSKVRNLLVKKPDLKLRMGYPESHNSNIDSSILTVHDGDQKKFQHRRKTFWDKFWLVSQVIAVAITIFLGILQIGIYLGYFPTSLVD